MTLGDTSRGRRFRPGAAGWRLAVLVGTAVLLPVVTWPRVAAMNCEWDDCAASSVPAGGEALFRDVLGIPSPIGGQRVAGIRSISAWVSLTAARPARLFGGVSGDSRRLGALLHAAGFD